MLQSSTIGLIDQKTYKLNLKMKVSAEEINPYNLHIKVEKAIKVARDKKVADDGVLGDVLELLAEDGITTNTQLESGPRISLMLQQWP
jgi:hypothetical protein